MSENWETNWKDYYKILQVHPTAEQQVIKGAYEKLARKYHPDVNKSQSANARIADINEAYEILSDLEKRKEYHSAWLLHSNTADSARTRSTSPPKSQTRDTSSIYKRGIPFSWRVGAFTILVIIVIIVLAVNSLTNNPSTTDDSQSILPPTSTSTPASFSVTELSVDPTQIILGNSTNITAKITNTGGTSGTYYCVVMINNFKFTEKNIYINAGKSEFISYSAKFEEVGNYKISVGSKSVDVNVTTYIAQQTTTATPTSTIPAPFSIKEWEVVDDQLQSFLQMELAWSGDKYWSLAPKLYLSLENPDGVELPTSPTGIQFGTAVTKLPMTKESMVTPKAGQYTLLVRDSDKNVVFTIPVNSFKGIQTYITQVRIVWDSIYNIAGIDINNDGDLPAYIANSQVWIGTQQPSNLEGLNLIAPAGTASFVACRWESSNYSEFLDVEVQLYDSESNLIAANESIVHCTEGKAYFNWDWAYTIDYPNDWTLTEYPDAVQHFSSAKLMSVVEIIDITETITLDITVWNIQETTLNDFVNDLIAFNKSQFTNYSIYQEKQVYLYGIPVRIITVEIHDRERGEGQSIVEVWAVGNYLYLMQGLGSPDCMTQLVEILGTFRFIYW